ncbi:MAG: DNA/RNA nuclease SfsA [Ancalomicrobiaceae bacterium]|nr:DNA/RNA nuclease SfsA [Ancalomicrobiaceae bacterium]
MQLPVLVPGTLIKRYKRFLADVDLDNGGVVTAHCANSGSMLGLQTPGARVHLSHSPDPKRKLAYSFELVEAHGGLVNVNTARANGVAAEAIAAGLLPTLAGYATLRREVAYGANSRVDILLDDPGRGRAYVEVKSVTLARTPGLAEFPDAVTARGSKHLAELSDMVAEGHRAIMLYVVQVPGSTRFSTAADIDPAYARAFDRARAAGVEAIAALAEISLTAIAITATIPIV